MKKNASVMNKNMNWANACACAAESFKGFVSAACYYCALYFYCYYYLYYRRKQSRLKTFAI